MQAHAHQNAARFRSKAGHGKPHAKKAEQQQDSSPKPMLTKTQPASDLKLAMEHRMRKSGTACKRCLCQAPPKHSNTLKMVARDAFAKRPRNTQTPARFVAKPSKAVIQQLSRRAPPHSEEGSADLYNMYLCTYCKFIQTQHRWPKIQKKEAGSTHTGF